MRALCQWLKMEILKVLPAIIFFAISFNLVNFTERLTLRPFEITNAYTSYLTATIGALLVGKLIIIVNCFSFINAFPHKPLIYNILWKLFIYGLLTLLFRMMDDYIHIYWLDGSSSAAYHYVSAKLISPFFWAIQLWILMLFAVYITANEFFSAIGKDKIIKLLLGKNS